MDTSELIAKVRRIEIKTKGLSNHIFSGEYHTVFKGRGMSFSEVRSYQYGDDVRNIDWNVTARTGDPHVKVFEEEREMTVMLLIDVSGSSFFGTQLQHKNEYIAEIAAVLSFSAIANNDKIGVIFFSNTIEKYIPPKKGKQHILRIISELLKHQPEGSGTNIGLALEYLNNVSNKRCTTFILSDFLTEESYEKPLTIAARKHDVIGINIRDKHENKLPDIGVIRVRDAETGQERWLDTGSKNIQKAQQDFFNSSNQYFEKTFPRCGADTMKLTSGEAYTKPLMEFFNKRK